MQNKRGSEYLKTSRNKGTDILEREKRKKKKKKKEKKNRKQ